MIAAALAGVLTAAYVLFIPQQIARGRQSNRAVSGLVVTQRESAYFDVTSFEADNSREDRATTSSFGLGADSNVGPDEKIATLGGSTTVADDSLSDHNRSIPVLISSFQAKEISKEAVERDANAPDACTVRDDPVHIGTSLIVGAGEAIESDFCSATDADWIGMEMEAGQAYAIAIHWLDDVDRDWATPYIAGVNDSVGELITGIHSFGGNPNSVVNTPGEITFRAVKTGTYYLEVKPNPCCDYALMLVPGAYSVEVRS